MSTWKLAPAIAITLLVGCGPPAQQVEAPALPDPEAEAPPADPGAADNADSSDSPASEDSDSGDAEAAEPEPKLPPVEQPKSCAGLSESTCKVTEGCAWSTTEDCIQQ